jgi:riboflavin kinase/FMN adenylyltransferase
VIVIPFTRELMRVTARQFLTHLTHDLGATALCVGDDFALGQGRQGTIPALRELDLLDIIAVPVLALPGQASKISSSAIRRAIAAGVPTQVAITAQATMPEPGTTPTPTRLPALVAV